MNATLAISRFFVVIYDLINLILLYFEVSSSTKIYGTFFSFCILVMDTITIVCCGNVSKRKPILVAIVGDTEIIASTKNRTTFFLVVYQVLVAYWNQLLMII